MSKNLTVIQQKQQQYITIFENMSKNNQLSVPANYDLSKNIRTFGLHLLKTVDKKGESALEVCSERSIIQVAQELFSKGLDLDKKQAYLIVRGGELTLNTSYFGNQSQALRDCGVIITAQVIWNGDKFSTEIQEDGTKRVKQHEQTFENITGKFDDIKGAYAVAKWQDTGKIIDVDAMSKAEILNSWAKSSTSGAVHKEFPTKMAKKTVISRLANSIINTYNPYVTKDVDEEIEYQEIEPINIGDYDNKAEPAETYSDNISNVDIKEPTIESDSIETESNYDNIDMKGAVVYDLKSDNVDYFCKDCGAKLTEAVVKFYEKINKQPELCYNCQQERKNK